MNAQGKKSKFNNSFEINSYGIATQKGVVDLWEINNREIKVNYPKKFKRPPNLEIRLLTGRNNYQIDNQNETCFTIIKGGSSSTINSQGIKLEWIARGELAEFSERQLDISETLPPKPPEFLQKLKWLWQNKTNYWLLIIISGILVVSFALFKANLPLFFSQKPSQKVKTPPLATAESTSKKDNQLPALRVTFIDDQTALVDLTVHIHVDPEKIISTHSMYGGQKAAVDDLLSSIRGNAIALLEKYSLPNARTSRKEIAEAIIRSSKLDMDRTGHIIDSISLAEFTVKNR
jgi:hypothetical protein